MAIVMDLESVAVDGIEIEPVTAPANYKDEAKIAAYIAEAERAQREKAALDPWRCRVACLGWIDADGNESVLSCATEQEEAESLQLFWRDTRSGLGEHFAVPIFGFNHLAFDLPVVLARSMLLGIKTPHINLNKYNTPNTDLLQVLTWKGVTPARSLKWFAKRFGIPVEDTVTGKDIAGLVAARDWPAVEAHCRSDIRTTKALAERLGFLRGGKAAAA